MCAVYFEVEKLLLKVSLKLSVWGTNIIIVHYKNRFLMLHIFVTLFLKSLKKVHCGVDSMDCRLDDIGYLQVLSSNRAIDKE